MLSFAGTLHLGNQQHTTHKELVSKKEKSLHCALSLLAQKL